MNNEREHWLELQGIGLTESDVRIVEDVTLTVSSGRTAILGPNGAGKSTLMRALAGQVHPSHGEVTLDGKPLARYGRLDLARRIGFLPQDVRASFTYTCEEVVAQGRYPHLGPLGFLSRHDREIVWRCMEWTSTQAFARRPIDELSGGERQRVLLASVLAQGSSFLLLDEPTSALDPPNALLVVETVSRLRTARGLSIVAVTHQPDLVRRLGGGLLYLVRGRVEAFESIDGPDAGAVADARLQAFLAGERTPSAASDA